MSDLKYANFAAIKSASAGNMRAYVPSVILSHLATEYARGDGAVISMRQSFTTATLWADISGFTALSESLAAQEGRQGGEQLARHLNSYFSQMVRIIGSHGGDILKFAGDALLVLWPDSPEMRLEERASRAAQCALELQEQLHRARLCDGVCLSVKCGVGLGDVTLLHLGGEPTESLEDELDLAATFDSKWSQFTIIDGQMECIAVGDGLQQAFDAEHFATAGGDVVMSQKAWQWISDCFIDVDASAGSTELLNSTLFTMAFVRIARDGKGVSLQPHKKIRVSQMLPHGGTFGSDGSNEAAAESDCRLQSALRHYLCPSLRHAIGDEGAVASTSWVSELRGATILFTNLGFGKADQMAVSEYFEATKRANRLFQVVRDLAQANGGSINKVRHSLLTACRGRCLSC